MRRTRRRRYGRVRGGALRMTRQALHDGHNDDVEGLGKRWVEKRDRSETRSRMEGSGCNPLAIGRGAGCRGEERMVNGLKVGRWKRENEKKGGRRSKEIESTRDEGMRMRGACKMARAHNGVNWGADASNARKGREMGFGEEDGVVGWARGSALGHHLHRGEQRWTLDERPLERRERQRVDRNGNIGKRCTTRHCDPSYTAVTNNLCWKLSHPHRRANR
jgi:hypothetical protein